MGWLPAVALLLLARLGVSYDITARLDEPARAIAGVARIQVTNLRDRPMDDVGLLLHPEAFSSRETDFAREMERMKNFKLAWSSPHQRGGITIESPASGSHRLVFEQRGTGAVLLVEPPLQPGDTLRLEVDFTTRIPDFFFERFGCRGRTFLLSHWYPMIPAELGPEGGNGPSGVHPAGWAPAARADYFVTLTVPEDQVVAATGRPVPDSHPGAILSDSVAGHSRDKTLVYEARDVSEFAWACSPDWSVRRAESRGLELAVYARDRNRGAWRDVPFRARGVAGRCADWYGPAPLDHLALVDLSGIAPADAYFPGLATITTAAIPFTRLLERAVCRQVALHWFSEPAAPQPLGSSWLSIGPAVMTEVRWLEETYGPTNLLDISWPGPLAGLGDRYYHRLAYYLAHTNGVLGSIARPRFDYTTNPFSYSEARFSQAGGFFLMLRAQLGPGVLDRACRGYLVREADSRTPRAAFIDACAAAADRDVNWLFDHWLENPGHCDYAVTRARRAGNDIEVDIIRRGSVMMPVDVELLFTDGSRLRRTWDLPAQSGSLQFPSPKRLRRVALDPDRKLLEPDRWNNYWPRRVNIHPLVALPSFDEYQLFYGPYAWYDDYHGLQLGAWLQGRQFVEAGPLRGRHSWTASLARTFRRDDWQPSVSYATPLPFLSERLRFFGAARYSPRITTIEGILEQGLSPVLRRDGATAQLTWLLQDLSDTVARDSRAWEIARTSELGFRLLHTSEARRFRESGSVNLGWGSRALGGGYDYVRASVEQHAALRLSRTRTVSVRLFAGGIAGSVPLQRRFYLSGGLVATPEEPASWAYQGPASGQEHWHYDADVNCRGWAGEYEAGRWGWGANVHLKLIPVVQPFLDIGNVGDDPLAPGFWRPRLDAGVRLKLAWFYADFPAWRWRVGAGDPEFIFKWMVGLNLAGFADF